MATLASAPSGQGGNAKPPRSRRARLRPTLRDVAQRAGVSNMTASRVINNEKGVGPEKRALVERAMRDLNYVPNLAAQALASIQLAEKVAFLFDTQNAAALGEMVSAGSEEAVRLNVKLIFVRARADDDPAKTLAVLEKRQVRGVILSAPLCDDVRLCLVLREAGIRVVAVGSGEAWRDLSSIGIDDERAAYDLTRYLLRLGHRRIGFLAGHPRHRSSERRKAGYQAALAEHGIKPIRALQWDGYDGFDAAPAVQQALALKPRPTAIIAASGDLAGAVVSMARARGLAVPRALTVCGFDDGDESPNSPRLTAVRPPLAKMIGWGIRQLAGELTALSRGEAAEVRNAVVVHEISYRETDAPPEEAPAPLLNRAANTR